MEIYDTTNSVLTGDVTAAAIQSEFHTDFFF